MPAPAPVDDPAAVRDAAREVLDGAGFVEPEEHWYSPILRVITDPIGTLERVIDWVIYYIVKGASVSWVAWLIVIVLAILIAIAVVRLTRSTKRDDTISLQFVSGLSDRSVAELETIASEHEAAQRWHEAVRVRYSMLIATLGDRGVVRVRAGRTIGEYQLELQDNAPSLSEPFNQASRLFEWIWYGNRAATADDVAAIRRLTDNMKSAAA